MGATPDTSVECVGPNNANYTSSVVVQVWRGVDTTTLLDDWSTTTAIDTGIPNNPSVIPITTGALVLILGHGVAPTTGSTTPTVPAGYSNLTYLLGTNGSSAHSNVAMASKAWSSGVEDPAVWTGFNSSTTASWGAITLALRPSGGLTDGTIGYSANTVPFGVNCQNNIHFTQGYWHTAFIEGDHTVARQVRHVYAAPSTGVAGTRESWTLSGQTVVRGYDFSLAQFPMQYKLPTLFCMGYVRALVKADGNLNTSFDTSAGYLEQLTTASAGWSWTDPASTMRSSNVDPNGRWWGAYYTTAAYAVLKVIRSGTAVTLQQAGLDNHTTIKTITGGSSGCKLLSFENADMGIIYTDAPGAALGIYFKYFDYPTSTWGSEETLPFSAVLYHIWYWQAAITRDGEVIAFWVQSATPTILRYAIRSAGSGGTWGAIQTGPTINSTHNQFACTTNLGVNNEVFFYYYDGTNLKYNTITNGTLGTAVTLVASVAALKTSGYNLQAPDKSINTFGLMYSLNDNRIVLATHTSASVEVGVNGTLVSQFGAPLAGTFPFVTHMVKYGTRTFYSWNGADGASYANVYNDTTKTWLYSDTKISVDYADIHNVICVAVSADGYVYTAAGSRISLTTAHIVIKKSDYPLDHASFTLAAFTDISPDTTGITAARGYKYMRVDDAGILHLLTLHESNLWLRNYNGSSWSTRQEIFNPTVTAPANNSYTIDMVLGKEASGQKSLHIALTVSDSSVDALLAGGNPAAETFYLKAVYQTARSYKIYKADGTELTTLPVTELTADQVYDGYVGSYYPRIWGGMEVLSDNTPIIAQILVHKTTFAPQNITVYKWTGSAWSATIVTSSVTYPTTGLQGWNPRITQEANGDLYVVSGDSVSNILQVVEYKSTDVGATWGAASYRTNENFSILNPAVDSDIMYQVTATSQHCELRFLPRIGILYNKIIGAYQAVKRAAFY